MCGISGIVTADGSPAPVDVVAAQLELLRHRGPDAEGIFTGPGAALAQNRLAIIDLVTGDPPIANEDGTVGAVLNGEIYNFATLRRSLEQRGHRLATAGDTEVLVHLAEDEADAGALARQLDGMFAFAVWDGRRGRLVLGRDRVGKKPLYYARTARGDLVFASEIKALFVHPALRSEFDESVLPAYLAFGYAPTPRTFFRGVASLPPACVLTFEPGKDPVVRSYWSPPRRSPESGRGVTLSEAAAGVRERLTRAVERRLVSDVPLGAFLSGGIDSSAIVAVAARDLGRPLATFTIGFDDRQGFDERPYARALARHLGTDHHEHVVAPDAVELVDRLVWHHDQPFGDASAVPTWYLSQVTRRDVTVALAGDGGDELFGGYERFRGALAARYYAGLPALLRRGLGAGVARAGSGDPRGRLAYIRRFVAEAELGLPDAYLEWVGTVGTGQRRALLGDGGDGALEEHHAVWDESAGASTLDRLLELNLRSYLVDDLLPKVDRMSMAHGLEVRAPFLDTELLEYAFGLPPRLKIQGPRLKRVLKAAVGDLLPSELVNRRKRGFGMPLDRWFREDLRAYAAGTLGRPDAAVRGYLSPNAIDAMLDDHWAGRRDLGLELWTLLTLEVFLRERA